MQCNSQYGGMKRAVAHRRRDLRADRARFAEMPKNNRSKVGNGALGIDGRSRLGRRWREVFFDAMRRTDGRNMQLCRGLASAVLQREALDAALTRGEPVDTGLLIKLSGEIRRLLTRLGLDADHEVIDGTQAAIDALRVGREEARA